MACVSEYNGLTCPVCLKHLTTRRKRTWELGKPGSCDHFFCLTCIFEWSKNVNTCPVDRKKFTHIDVYTSINDRPVRKVVVPHVNLKKFAEDYTYCEICRQCTREECLLLCDGCDKGYHMDCLNPILHEIPSGDWYCESCDMIVQSQYSINLSSTEDTSDYDRQFELDLSSDVDITGSDSSSELNYIEISDSDSDSTISEDGVNEFSLDTSSLSSDCSYLEIVDYENSNRTASNRLLQSLDDSSSMVDPLVQHTNTDRRFHLHERPNKGGDMGGNESSDSEFFSNKSTKRHKVIELSSQSSDSEGVKVGCRSSSKRKEKMSVFSDGSESEYKSNVLFLSSAKGKNPISSSRKEIVKGTATDRGGASSLLGDGTSHDPVCRVPLRSEPSSLNIGDRDVIYDAAFPTRVSHGTSLEERSLPPETSDESFLQRRRDSDPVGEGGGGSRKRKLANRNQVVQKKPAKRQTKRRKNTKTSRRKRVVADRRVKNDTRNSTGMKQVTADVKRISAIIGKGPTNTRRRRRRRRNRRRKRKSNGASSVQARSRARTAATHTPRQNPMRAAVMESYRYTNQLEGLEWARAVLNSSMRRRGYHIKKIPTPCSGYVRRTRPAEESDTLSSICRTYGFTPNRCDPVRPSLVSKAAPVTLFSKSRLYPASSDDNNSSNPVTGEEEKLTAMEKKKSLEIQRRLSKRGRCLSRVVVTPVKLPSNENGTNRASASSEGVKKDLLGRLCQGLDDLESRDNIIKRDGTIIPIRNVDFSLSSEISSEEDSTVDDTETIKCKTTPNDPATPKKAFKQPDDLTRQFFPVFRKDPLTSNCGHTSGSFSERRNSRSGNNGLMYASVHGSVSSKKDSYPGPTIYKKGVTGKASSSLLPGSSDPNSNSIHSLFSAKNSQILTRNSKTDLHRPAVKSRLSGDLVNDSCFTEMKPNPISTNVSTNGVEHISSQSDEGAQEDLATKRKDCEVLSLRGTSLSTRNAMLSLHDDCCNGTTRSAAGRTDHALLSLHDDCCNGTTRSAAGRTDHALLSLHDDCCNGTTRSAAGRTDHALLSHDDCCNGTTRSAAGRTDHALLSHDDCCNGTTRSAAGRTDHTLLSLHDDCCNGTTRSTTGRTDHALLSLHRCTRSSTGRDDHAVLSLHDNDRCNGTTRSSTGRDDHAVLSLHDNDRCDGTRSSTGRDDHAIMPLHDRSTGRDNSMVSSLTNDTKTAGTSPRPHNGTATRSAGRAGPTVSSDLQCNGTATRSAGRADPTVSSALQCNGTATRSAGRADPTVSSALQCNGTATRSAGRADPIVSSALCDGTATRSAGRAGPIVSSALQCNGTATRSAGRAGPTVSSDLQCDGDGTATRSAGRAGPTVSSALQCNGDGTATRSAGRAGPIVSSSLQCDHSTESSNADEPRKIIGRALDRHFDNGEITNRQYKRILERASKKVMEGLSRLSYMNEKRVVKLVADYVTNYSYQEP